jgi:hypothetical protein
MPLGTSTKLLTLCTHCQWQPEWHEASPSRGSGSLWQFKGSRGHPCQWTVLCPAEGARRFPRKRPAGPSALLAVPKGITIFFVLCFVFDFLLRGTALAVRMARGMGISLVLAWAWAQVTIDASECMAGQCERASFLTHLTDTYRSLSAVFSAQRESCARTDLPVGRSVDGHRILAGPTTKPVRSTVQSLEPQARRISGTSPASHVALASYADFVARLPSHA